MHILHILTYISSDYCVFRDGKLSFFTIVILYEGGFYPGNSKLHKGKYHVFFVTFVDPGLSVNSNMAVTFIPLHRSGS